ncbi:MAG: 3-phosphoglycerate dehydrogenase [Candidatus Fimenecus sp.]
MNNYKIKTLNKISEIGLEVFSEKYEISDDFLDPDAIMVRSASMLEMQFGKNLKAIARAGAGTNNIPIERCSEKGICVFNTPGANANAVKELVLCALFLSSRKIINGIDWVKTLDNDSLVNDVEKGKSLFSGPEIKDKTLGIIGFGTIGKLVAEAAAFLGMNVIYYDPYTVEGESANRVELPELYNRADYITIHTPFNKKTEKMINSAAISQMKNGVRILNFARGEIVDNKDIIKAVESEKVFSYITDFAVKELIGIKGIVVIPHLGASTPESENNCAVMAANEIRDYIENGNIVNSKNLPDISLERSGKFRITVIYENIENIGSYVSDILRISIKAMTKGEKNKICYSIIDTDNEFDKSDLEFFRSNKKIKKVRVI